MSMSFGAPESAIAGGGSNLQLQQAHTIGGPGFPAHTGYDLPTGLGAPIVSGLLTSFAPTATAGYTQPLP